jgi:class 3 adenylate cyclase
MAVQHSLLCKGCWQNLHMPVALRGVLSAPFRVVGLKPSRMNPNTCTFCELMFSKVMRATKVTIDASILFADLRSYTKLSQDLSADEMAGLLDTFYDDCAEAIWEQDGILNKTIGDAVMAVFNFPIQHADHAARAVRAGRQIQRRAAEHRIAVGIGISSGTVSFGEFGRSHRDLTAIGTVVNTAARAQGAAQPGEILVTEAVRERAAEELPGAVATPYDLKGFDRPVLLCHA